MSVPSSETIPASARDLVHRLQSLRGARRKRKAKAGQRRARASLTADERVLVLEKTAGRCHVCGGVVDEAWQADHVLAHSGGGPAKADNCLPAHKLCNNYRWDYLPEELQVILKLGVWVRTQVEKETPVGRLVGEAFVKHERKRLGRRAATLTKRVAP